MGYFSEMALNKQEELGLPAEQVPAGDAFEDEETFDELPVPSASRSAVSPAVETPPSPAFDADDGAEELAEMNRDDASEAEGADGDDAGKEQEAPAKADVTTDADEEKRRAEHEAAEAKRKAEWEARQAEKKKAEQEQLERLAAMSDDEVVNASMQRVSTDTEKLTRRNMKECVAEFIQTKCLEDIAFARLTMHPRKSMIHCFQYISRKAWDYIQDELKASGIQPGPGSQGYRVSSMPLNLLTKAQHLPRQIFIRHCRLAAAVMVVNAFVFHADLCRLDGTGDLTCEHMTAIGLADKRVDLPRQCGTAVHHGQHNAVHLQLRVELPFHAGDGSQKLLQSFGWKILRLHGDNHAVRRSQGVDGQHTEGRHTVDERVIVAVCHGGQILPQHRFTAHGVDQRDLQCRQLDIGGDKVDAG